MPNRYIKESCVSSPTLTALSDAAERFFWRLTTVADDYGRFDANPAVLLGRCVPTLNWTQRQVALCLAELCQIVDGDEFPLVEVYRVKGRLYGRLTNWFEHQRDRSKEKNPPKPKFPPPELGLTVPPQAAAICRNLQQLAALNESESESENVSDNEHILCISPQVAASARQVAANGRDYRKEAKEVLAFLNEKAEKTFRDTDTNLDFIIARLKSNVDVQTCKTLIVRKVRDWKTREDMAMYLRPETLFNRKKFETYIAEVT